MMENKEKENGCCGGGCCGGEENCGDEEEREQVDQSSDGDVEENQEQGSQEKEPSKSSDELVEEYLEGWKRCQAEFENYKKSKLNLEQDMAGRAVENLVFQLLPVLDNFHASVDHIPDEQKESGWVQGIMYIQQQLETVLKENGVEEIAASPGETFDPSLHEAVEDQAEDKDKKKESKKSSHKIKKVLQKGYKIKERIVRPVRVVVE